MLAGYAVGLPALRLSTSEQRRQLEQARDLRVGSPLLVRSLKHRPRAAPDKDAHHPCLHRWNHIVVDPVAHIGNAAGVTLAGEGENRLKEPRVGFLEPQFFRGYYEIRVEPAGGERLGSFGRLVAGNADFESAISERANSGKASG